MTSKKAVAYHEAGHAVAAIWLLEEPHTEATILPSDGCAGFVLESPETVRGRIEMMMGGSNINDSEWEGRVLRIVCVLLAGEYSQKKGAPGSWRIYHGGGDREAINEYLVSYYGLGLRLCLAAFQFCVERTKEFLNDGKRWKEVESVAYHLLKHETLTAVEIRQAMCRPFTTGK